MKVYEVIYYNPEVEGWGTFKSNIKTKKEAVKVASKLQYDKVDINLIIDDDLTETYDKKGRIR